MRDVKLQVETTFISRTGEWLVEIFMVVAPTARYSLGSDHISGISYPDPMTWVAQRFSELFFDVV